MNQTPDTPSVSSPDAAGAPAADPIERAPIKWTEPPRTEAIELDDAFEISAEIPGVPVGAAGVEFHDGVLSIEAIGERPVPGGNGARRSPGRFTRQFRVTEPVDADAITAHHAHGVLSVRLPRRTPARRTIPVQSG